MSSLKSVFIVLVLMFISLHVAHANQKLPLREMVVVIDPDISGYNKESSSSNPGISGTITKHTVVYPRYGYITTYQWKPCTDYDSQVVFSGGFKLQQSNDKNAEKFYITNSNAYTDNGWTWKVTNGNNTNLAMDLYVQCGGRPFNYVQKSTVHSNLSLGMNYLESYCPANSVGTRLGINVGFTLANGGGGFTQIEPWGAYYEDMSTAGSGQLDWYASTSGQNIGLSLICGDGWDVFGGDNGNWILLYDLVGYKSGSAVIVPAGSKATTATASCYIHSEYLNPLSVSLYNPYVVGVAAPAYGLRLIASYVSNATGYITVANPGTVDIYIVAGTTCDGNNVFWPNSRYRYLSKPVQ